MGGLRPRLSSVPFHGRTRIPVLIHTTVKYDPHRTDLPFAAQAASLCAAHHSLRIFIHRPFIPMLRKTPTALPALAICTNAARACANIVDLQTRRKGEVPVPFNFVRCDPHILERGS